MVLYPCVLASSLFTSGLRRDSIAVRPLWQDLYASSADLVLNGHVHHYEHFSPQKPDGSADPKRGITQFTVGTGGRDLEGSFPVQENSQIRLSKFFGVLKLELGESSFVWEFISESGQVLDNAVESARRSIMPHNAVPGYFGWSDCSPANDVSPSGHLNDDGCDWTSRTFRSVDLRYYPET